MPKTYRHLFQVRGTRPFPHDMLRYDSCFPQERVRGRRGVGPPRRPLRRKRGRRDDLPRPRGRAGLDPHGRALGELRVEGRAGLAPHHGLLNNAEGGRDRGVSPTPTQGLGRNAPAAPPQAGAHRRLVYWVADDIGRLRRRLSRTATAPPRAGCSHPGGGGLPPTAQVLGGHLRQIVAGGDPLESCLVPFTRGGVL